MFDCLVNEMLFIRPRTHTERAKRFNSLKSICIISFKHFEKLIWYYTLPQTL